MMTQRALIFSTWADSYYWLKKWKLTSQAKLTLGLVVLVVVPIAVPSVVSRFPSATFALLAAGVMAIYLLMSQHYTEVLRRSFGDADMCAFRHVATPFTSMFSALNDQKVSLADISRVVVETGKFTNLFAYVNGDGKILMRLLEENPEASIHVFGCNDLSSDIADLRHELHTLGSPPIHFHNTGSVPVAHRNLVQTKDGKFYLWFEEHHEMENGHHYFPHGAFLFKISEETAVRVEQEVSQGVAWVAENKRAA